MWSADLQKGLPKPNEVRLESLLMANVKLGDCVDLEEGSPEEWVFDSKPPDAKGGGGPPRVGKRLFDYNLVYPTDEVGPYIELWGVVLEASEFDEGKCRRVEVETDEGRFSGYAREPFRPDPGDHVRLRIYDSGGGFYPDDRVTGWRRR